MKYKISAGILGESVEMVNPRSDCNVYGQASCLDWLDCKVREF
jgi:hypothetical protein